MIYIVPLFFFSTSLIQPRQVFWLGQKSFQKFRWVFGRFEDFKIPFRNLLTFKANIKNLNAKTPKWYMPVINTSNNTDPEAAEARKKRVKMLSTVVTIASLNIVIDILTGKYFF